MTDTETPSSGSRPAAGANDIEIERLRFEKTRFRTDVLKWVVIAVGAVVSFWVIDYGRLRLDQLRVNAENKRAILTSYLQATETAQPDVWKRKLHILLNFADDPETRSWVLAELEYIEKFAALDALYRETLKVASRLVEPGRVADPDRALARERFNQLYWADLPFAGESPEVVDAMIQFRNGLIVAERAGPDAAEAWSNLNVGLIHLSKALRDTMPKYTARPPGG